MEGTVLKRPRVFVTRRLPEAVEARMRELFDARLNIDDKPMSQAELAEAVKTAHVLVPTVTDRIDRSLLSQAGPQLKLIANFGNGVDNIDLDTARVRGIIVTNTPGVLDKSGQLLTDLTARRIDELFADGTISGGMLPKIAGALDAAKSGVNAVHIIDGRVPHAMLLEILTDQAYGTMIRAR